MAAGSIDPYNAAHGGPYVWVDDGSMMGLSGSLGPIKAQITVGRSAAHAAVHACCTQTCMHALHRRACMLYTHVHAVLYTHVHACYTQTCMQCCTHVHAVLYMDVHAVLHTGQLIIDT